MNNPKMPCHISDGPQDPDDVRPEPLEEEYNKYHDPRFNVENEIADRLCEVLIDIAKS